MKGTFDFNKIKGRLTTPMSSEEALKDVTPFQWSKCVLSGEKKILVWEAEIKNMIKIKN